MSKFKNQTSEILEHLKKTGSITTKEAYDLYGCSRLSARIYDLKERGYLIKPQICLGKTKYGETSRYTRYVFEGREFE